MSLYDKQRVPFLVKSWSESTNTGTVVDREGIVYRIDMDSLDVTALGRAYVGEQLSGYAEGPTRVSDLLPDLQLSHERDRVESAGPVEENVGWTPRIGDPRYCLGTPDSGKFSGPLSPESIRDMTQEKSSRTVANKSLTISTPETPQRGPYSSRLVPKAACPDKNQLAEFIRQTTGGQVTALGEPIDREMYWEIETFSGDGKP